MPHRAEGMSATVKIDLLRGLWRSRRGARAHQGHARAARERQGRSVPTPEAPLAKGRQDFDIGEGDAIASVPIRHLPSQALALRDRPRVHGYQATHHARRAVGTRPRTKEPGAGVGAGTLGGEVHAGSAVHLSRAVRRWDRARGHRASRTNAAEQLDFRQRRRPTTLEEFRHDLLADAETETRDVRAGRGGCVSQRTRACSHRESGARRRARLDLHPLSAPKPGPNLTEL